MRLFKLKREDNSVFIFLVLVFFFLGSKIFPTILFEIKKILGQKRKKGSIVHGILNSPKEKNGSDDPLSLYVEYEVWSLKLGNPSAHEEGRRRTRFNIK